MPAGRTGRSWNKNIIRKIINRLSNEHCQFVDRAKIPTTLFSFYQDLTLFYRFSLGAPVVLSQFLLQVHERILRPARRIIGHFGDESYHEIN